MSLEFQQGWRGHSQEGLHCTVEQINRPGAYVTEGGSLLRIPNDALVEGCSPGFEIISKNGESRVTKVSENPFVTLPLSPVSWSVMSVP